MNDRHVAGDLGVYLAGALDRSERWAVETHLASCRWCVNELTELREVTALLEGVPPEVLLDGPPEGGDLLLRRAVREVRRESGGGRRKFAAAAAAVVLGAAGLGGGYLFGHETAPPTVVVAAPASAPTLEGALTGQAVDGRTGAQMAVAVLPAAGWVRLSATISGIPQGEHCRLVVVAADGSREAAGTWEVSESGEEGGTTLDGSALVAPQDVRAVEVETTDGKRYVSVPV